MRSELSGGEFEVYKEGRGTSEALTREQGMIKASKQATAQANHNWEIWGEKPSIVNLFPEWIGKTARVCMWAVMNVGPARFICACSSGAAERWEGT